MSAGPEPAAMAEVRIGTSGWHYKHWRGNFYPESCPVSKMLEEYGRYFDTVEINSSFYKLPDPETFSRWREQTPPGFTFAVKASYFITHNKKLSDPENALTNFLPRAELLKEKLGPVLFQLPPRWNINLERLEQFLRALHCGHSRSGLHRVWSGKQRQYAFEFRNPTWLIPDTYALLRRYNAAFCIFELAGFTTPVEITADWTYIRLHGPGGKYQGSYSKATLRKWAGELIQWSRHLHSIYVYFDNDQAGYAARNALQLKTLLQHECGRNTFLRERGGRSRRMA
jgi:uncharacterized protein YecE (DUF72 family)